jgi:hypothetical protein
VVGGGFQFVCEGERNESGGRQRLKEMKAMLQSLNCGKQDQTNRTSF